MSDYGYNGSLRSIDSDYDPSKAFKPYSTGTFDPEEARADMLREQTGIDVRKRGHHGPSNSRPKNRHTDRRHERRSSQASSSDSDGTVRPASPPASKSAYRREPGPSLSRSPAPSTSSQHSRLTARQLPPQDGRQQLSGQTREGAPLLPRQVPNYNKTSERVYGSPQHFTPNFGAGSSNYDHSHRASSPQGPGKGPTPLELQDRMDRLPISRNSGSRSDVSGGSYNQGLVPRCQRSDQKSPADLSPYSIDFAPLDIRDRMQDMLRPLEDAALPFVRPEDFLRAKGAAVMARERFISQVEHGMSHGNNTSAYPRHAGGHRRVLEAPPHGGYTNCSERSAFDDEPLGKISDEERQSSHMSRQSGRVFGRTRTANSQNLQVERFQAVPRPPSSQRSTRRSAGTQRMERSAFRDFGDDQSMHRSGRGSPMNPSRGGRYPDDMEDEW